MRRASTKKGGTERRKRKRGQAPQVLHSCEFCGKKLEKEDRALFVEEEIGRIFCTEECISGFFGPEIARLEKEYHRKFLPSDLPEAEREKFGHLRWITLQEPDEIWREKTLAGDYRYTLISEFLPTSKPVWCVCICLFLRGEPSFLFLSFVTKNPAMARHYRKGERIQRNDLYRPQGSAAEEKTPEVAEFGPSDRLASEWTEDETYLAQMNRGRSENDIPQKEFELYQSCLEETLEGPTEVWTFQLGQKNPIRLFHFIRHYPDERPGMWYVIVARETDQDDQIEIIDAFPTRDPQLLSRYRMGEQELGIGLPDSSAPARVVH